MADNKKKSATEDKVLDPRVLAYIEEDESNKEAFAEQREEVF